MAEAGREGRQIWDGWRDWPWRLLGLAALLAIGSLVFAVDGVTQIADERALRADGVEVVAEVVGTRTTRSLSGYDVTEVRFTTDTGRDARAEVAVQQTPTLPVIDVRYDPDDPTHAEVVDDPAPLWLEDALLALILGVLTVLVPYGPRLARWRDRAGATAAAPPS